MELLSQVARPEIPTFDINMADEPWVWTFVLVLVVFALFGISRLFPHETTLRNDSSTDGDGSSSDRRNTL